MLISAACGVAAHLVGPAEAQRIAKGSADDIAAMVAEGVGFALTSDND